MNNQYKILATLGICLALFILFIDKFPEFKAAAFIMMIIIFTPIAYFLDDTK